MSIKKHKKSAAKRLYFKALSLFARLYEEEARADALF